MSASLERLTEVLEVYGGAVERWPAAERASLERLLAGSADARRRLAEARALDRLLDLAPVPEAGRVGALVEDIMRGVRSDAAGHGAGRGQRTPWRPRGDGWLAAGLLAACLVLGVYLGASGLALPALEQMGTVVAEAAGGDGLVDLAASDETGLEEEVL